MKFRWTIKELKEYDDLRLIQGLITERLSELNPYSPLAKRLKEIRKKIDTGEPLTGETKD